MKRYLALLPLARLVQRSVFKLNASHGRHRCMKMGDRIGIPPLGICNNTIVVFGFAFRPGLCSDPALVPP